MIKTFPYDERPRERCLRLGPQALSLRECLAIVIGSGPKGKGCLGVALDILQHFGPGLEESEQEKAFFASLETFDLVNFSRIPGLKEAGLTKLLASFEIGRRYYMLRCQKPLLDKISDRREVDAINKIPLHLRASAKEWFGFVAIERSGRLGAFCLVEQGTRSHVNFDLQEFFARLLVFRPMGVYVFHNHPSGSLEPSTADIETTDRIGTVALEFGIHLLGHYIVTVENQREI